jgi:cysteine-rich repeat protein
MSGSGTGGSTGDTTGDPGDPCEQERPDSCGNGVVDPGEDCDDGNDIDGDGCNNGCTESGSPVWLYQYTNHRLYDVVVNDNLDLVVVLWRGIGADGEHLIWVRAQTGGLRWSDTIGDPLASHVFMDSAGSYVAVGHVDTHLWMRKYASDGDILWTRTHEDAEGISGYDAAALGPDDELIVSGFAADVILSAYDSNGDPIWQIPTAEEDPFIKSRGVAVDAEGSPTVAGYITPDFRDIWIRRYDPSQAEAWTVEKDGPASSSDEASKIAIDAEGNVTVIGTVRIVGELKRIWIGSYGPDGAPRWAHTIVKHGDGHDEGIDIAAAPDGSVVILGGLTEGEEPWGGFDDGVTVRKYGPDGALIWGKNVAPEGGLGGGGLAVDRCGATYFRTGMSQEFPIGVLLKLEP